MKIFRRSEAVIGLIVIVAMILIGIANPAFWDLDNLFGLLQSNIVIGIMALGVLLVMVSGGIDVSFPAIAIAGMYLTVNGMLMTHYEGVFLPFLVSTLIGLVLGGMNALFVHKFKMIPLIVTLGTASIVRGLVLGIVGGLFVLETVSVIVQVASFKLTGKRVFRMAPLHHHFEKKGWAEPTVVIRFWIIAGILALAGLSTLKLR